MMTQLRADADPKPSICPLPTTLRRRTLLQIQVPKALDVRRGRRALPVRHWVRGRRQQQPLHPRRSVSLVTEPKNPAPSSRCRLVVTGETPAPVAPKQRRGKARHSKPRHQPSSQQLEEVQQPVSVKEPPEANRAHKADKGGKKKTKTPTPVAETRTKRPWLQADWVKWDTCLASHRSLPAWDEFPGSVFGWNPSIRPGPCDHTAAPTDATTARTCRRL